MLPSDDVREAGKIVSFDDLDALKKASFVGIVCFRRFVDGRPMYHVAVPGRGIVPVATSVFAWPGDIPQSGITKDAK